MQIFGGGVFCFFLRSLERNFYLEKQLNPPPGQKQKVSIIKMGARLHARTHLYIYKYIKIIYTWYTLYKFVTSYPLSPTRARVSSSAKSSLWSCGYRGDALRNCVLCERKVRRSWSPQWKRFGCPYDTSYFKHMSALLSSRLLTSGLARSHQASAPTLR